MLAPFVTSSRAQRIYLSEAISHLRSKQIALRSNIFRGVAQLAARAVWATTPKRRRWRMQRGVVGAAVEMARRSKAQSHFGHRKRERRSAAGGGCSEALLAQRSKWRAAPRRKAISGTARGRAKQAVRRSRSLHFFYNFIFRGVAQLVARLLWEQDAGCSSHLTPTRKGSDPRDRSPSFVDISPSGWYAVGEERRVDHDRL